MAKDKKAKAAEKKARTAAKQEKKGAKKEKKATKKAKESPDSDAESVDLDAVLAEYAKQQEQFLKVTETPCEPPSPRSSATLIANPTNDNELFLFGGEYFNGATASFYNDLFVYNIKRDTWSLITSPNSPLPRSGHAWCRAGNTKEIYLFGGEFSSPKQGTFYHYNDFWRLDPASREWTRIESKGKASSPPARSGHRMTYYKNYIILFGGFQDTSQTTKYLQDLWVYDCTNFNWFEPKLPPAAGRPDARSSFSFLPSEQGAVLYGGYSRVKVTAGSSNQKGRSSGGGQRMVLKPKVHEDAWFLRIQPAASDAAANTLPKIFWERRKRPANPPNPPRAGTTMAFHKGRGILFGGVHDVEESEDGIDSEFFNTLFVWNIERNRYFPLALRRLRAQPVKKAGGTERGAGGRRGRGKADEEELLANLKALEMRAAKGGQGAEVEAQPDEVAGKIEEEEEEEEVKEKPRIFEFPHPRFNAQLTVQDDVLYIFGGTFEKGDREFTFDEMWAIDLGKLDGVKEIFRRELEDWQGSEDEEDEDEDEEDESDEDEDEDRSEPASTAPTSVAQSPVVIAKEAPELQEEEVSALTDTLPHPRPFESLREFYARTGIQWQEIVVKELEMKGKLEEMLAKEIKTQAFGQAEEKWWDCREEIRALEDEQEQAGIGEVVSIADKGGDTIGGGVGRRR